MDTTGTQPAALYRGMSLLFYWFGLWAIRVASRVAEVHGVYRGWSGIGGAFCGILYSGVEGSLPLRSLVPPLCCEHSDAILCRGVS